MYYYIVNPTAGKAKFDKIQAEFLVALKLKKIEGEIVKTSEPKEAKKLAKLGVSKGNRMIIAVGGDATVEEVANGVIEAGKAGVAMGIVPLGKNNFFANTIGIKDWQAAVATLAAGKVKKFDLAQANDYYFLSSLDFGFPVTLAMQYAKQIAKQGSKNKLNIWNRLQIARELTKNSPEINFRLKVSSQYWAKFKVFAGSFGNTFFFNNPHGFKSIPSAADQKLQALFLHPFENKNLWYKALEFSSFRFGEIDQFSLIKEKNFILESEQKIDFKTAAFDFSSAKVDLKLHAKALGIIVEDENSVNKEETEPKQPKKLAQKTNIV